MKTIIFTNLIYIIIIGLFYLNRYMRNKKYKNDLDKKLEMRKREEENIWIMSFGFVILGLSLLLS